MSGEMILSMLASVVATSSPLLTAALGEMLTERSGVVNLSLDGTMLLAGAISFIVGYHTGSVTLAFAAGAGVGATMALIVAFGSIVLRQDQIAIGFVLTLLGDSLSAFVGQSYTRIRGASVPHWPLPLLERIPILGPILFRHNAVVYGSVLLVVVTWWWLYRTQAGLRLRGTGERPVSAYVRGVHVRRLRVVYTALGGALVGCAGSMYSLAIQLGWAEGHTRGMGWIALAIVIFGGWHPARIALGAYLFGALKAMVTYLQRTVPGAPVTLLNMAPWLLMIATLALVGSGWLERLLNSLPTRVQSPARRLLRSSPPQALGTLFARE